MESISGELGSVLVLFKKILLAHIVGDGQGGLVCCSSWRRKESDMTEQLN